jgi:hypothetical protein
MFSRFPVKLLSDLWYSYLCSEVLSMYIQFARRAGSDKLVELLNQWDLRASSACSSKFMLWTDTLPRWPCFFFFYQTLPRPTYHGVGGDSCWGGQIVGVSHPFPEGKQEVPREGTLLYAGLFPTCHPLGSWKGLLFLLSSCVRKGNGGAEKGRLFSFVTQFRFRTENNIGTVEKSILSPSLLRILPVTIHHCVLFGRSHWLGSHTFLCPLVLSVLTTHFDPKRKVKLSPSRQSAHRWY